MATAKQGNLVFWLILLILSVSFIPLILFRFVRPVYMSGVELRKQRDELKRAIEKEHHEIARINTRCERFLSDRDFVEHQARLNNRIRPGEIVFTFETPE